MTRLIATGMIVASVVGAAWSSTPHGDLAPSARQVLAADEILAGVEPLEWSARIAVESAEICEDIVGPAWVEYGSAASHLPSYSQLIRLWI